MLQNKKLPKVIYLLTDSSIKKVAHIFKKYEYLLLEI